MSCSSEFHRSILLYLELSPPLWVRISSSICRTCERLLRVTGFWRWLCPLTKEYSFNFCDVSRGTRELAKKRMNKTCMTIVLSAYSFALKNCTSGRGFPSPELWSCSTASSVGYFLFGVKQEVLSFHSLLGERCRCSQVCFFFENQPI